MNSPTSHEHARAVFIALTELGDGVPRSMLDLALKHRIELEPFLIAALKDERAWSFPSSDPRHFLPLHAILILGLFESEAAGVAIAKAIEYASKHHSDVIDEINGAWPALLKNKPDS